MKIKIIQPYIPAQAVFVETFTEMIRMLSYMGPLVLGALVPEQDSVDFVNENIETIDYDAPVDLVAITSLTASALRAYKIADLFRERGVTVVMGGMHPSVLPQEALLHADAVAIGEGEYTWPRIIEDFRMGRLQRIYKAERLTDMMGLPFPLRKIDKSLGYVEKVETTRGCPFRCDFCSTNRHFGMKHRTRPISDVVREIESLNISKHSWIMFTDDDIVGNKKYARELFQDLIPLKIKWASQCSLRIADDLELLRLAAESGCRALSLGFESVSQKNLRNSGKVQNKVEKYKGQVRRLHDYDIGVLSNFVFGFDEDTRDCFSETVEFLKTNGIEHAYFTILTPYPGTPLMQRLDSEGRILTKDWSLYDTCHAVFRPARMKPEELEEGLIWAYKQIYPEKEVLVNIPEGLNSLSPLNRASKFFNQLLSKISRYSNGGVTIKKMGYREFVTLAITDEKFHCQIIENGAALLEGGMFDLSPEEKTALLNIKPVTWKEYFVKEIKRAKG
ncbi:MAG: B12-binding domain-containing radical SAM protein [Nitrospinae bacterium]|nr:B12-binding domain-containing radical SAM protein [Nitrospinota bacterium]